MIDPVKSPSLIQANYSSRKLFMVDKLNSVSNQKEVFKNTMVRNPARLILTEDQWDDPAKSVG